MSETPRLYPGKQIHKLTLVEKTLVKGTTAKWLCRCDCGNSVEGFASNLYREHTKSCGCVRVARAQVTALAMQKANRENGQPSTTHGLSRSPTYVVWSHMIDRCHNQNCDQYKHYGGRGITVDPRWLEFENFYADMGERPALMTLERIDNDKGYSKDNCMWATRKQQARNTRTNRLITFNGRTQTLVEWSEETGLNYKTLDTRLTNGWSIERALTTPLN